MGRTTPTRMNTEGYPHKDQVQPREWIALIMKKIPGGYFLNDQVQTWTELTVITAVMIGEWTVSIVIMTVMIEGLGEGEMWNLTVITAMMGDWTGSMVNMTAMAEDGGEVEVDSITIIIITIRGAAE